MFTEKKFELLEKIEERLRMTDDELVNIKRPTKDNVGILKKIIVNYQLVTRLRQG